MSCVVSTLHVTIDMCPLHLRLAGKCIKRSCQTLCLIVFLQSSVYYILCHMRLVIQGRAWTIVNIYDKLNTLQNYFHLVKYLVWYALFSIIMIIIECSSCSYPGQCGSSTQHDDMTTVYSYNGMVLL